MSSLNSPSSPTPGLAKPTAKDRRDKRAQMRKALAANFDDTPIRKFTIPQELRKASAEIDKKFLVLEEKQRDVSASSQEFLPTSENEIKSFIAEREAVTNDAVAAYKEAKITAEQLREAGTFDRKTYKRMIKELDDNESTIALERGALARDRARISLKISADHLRERLGEAYMMAITDRMKLPANATIDLGSKRSGSDQTHFRDKLIQVYDGPEAVGRESLWCPAIKHYVISPEFQMKAAHLVPATIGETNAAYIFGVDLDEGFDCIWSAKNGLLLHASIEKALDNAQLVIIPRFDNREILRVVLLDQSLADKQIYETKQGIVRFKDLGDLEFKTQARPGLRNLYFNTLLAIFRRRRHGVPGHEDDFKKLKMSDNTIWATPGKWMRRSILRSLAADVGDILTEDLMKNTVGIGDFAHQESPEQERRRVADIRYGLEYGFPDEEDEEQDEEEDEED
jgi:hypothetical protein